MANLISSDPAMIDEVKSRLLGLPPELRTMIYEHALHEESGIQITNALKLPPLLSTCRQIFNECASIWFYSNDLEVDVVDCDAALYEAFRLLALRHGAYRVEITIMFSFPWNQPCWRNLKDCCHQYWERKDTRLMVNEDDDTSDLRVVTSAFEIVAAAVEEDAS